VYVRFCVDKELAWCLDLTLGGLIWRLVHRSPALVKLGSVALFTGVEECKKIED
jgi:hypothetical protein